MRDYLRKNATWIMVGCLGVGAISTLLLGGQRSKPTVLASAEPVGRRPKPITASEKPVRTKVSEPKESLAKETGGRRIRVTDDTEATIRRAPIRNDKVEVKRKKPQPGC